MNNRTVTPERTLATDKVFQIRNKFTSHDNVIELLDISRSAYFKRITDHLWNKAFIYLIDKIFEEHVEDKHGEWKPSIYPPKLKGDYLVKVSTKDSYYYDVRHFDGNEWQGEHFIICYREFEKTNLDLPF